MQKYFEKFNTIAYSFDDEKFYRLTDITRNVRFKKELFRDVQLYQTYHIVDGDTPEKISEKLYDTPHYHWIIILLNEMEDWINEFPLSDADFKKYIIDKYGSLSYAQNTIHHYVNQEGLIVFYDPLLDTVGDNRNLVYRETNGSLPTPVSIYETESLANDEKRKIKVLHRNQLEAILNQYGELM